MVDFIPLDLLKARTFGVWPPTPDADAVSLHKHSLLSELNTIPENVSRDIFNTPWHRTSLPERLCLLTSYLLLWQFYWKHNLNGNNHDTCSTAKTVTPRSNLMFLIGSGWKREVVLRNPANEVVDSTGKAKADVYYYPPKGKKLVSFNTSVDCFLHWFSRTDLCWRGFSLVDSFCLCFQRSLREVETYRKCLFAMQLTNYKKIICTC